MVVDRAARALPYLSKLPATFIGIGRCSSLSGLFRVGLLVPDEHQWGADLSCSMADSSRVSKIRFVRRSRLVANDDDDRHFKTAYF